MKKLLFLTLFCLLLAGCGSRSGAPSDPEDYFLEDGVSHAAMTTICYAQTPWDEARDLSDRLPALIEAGMLPALPEYNGFSATGLYRGQGEIFAIEMGWTYFDENDLEHYRQLTLNIYPEEPKDKTSIDGVYDFDPRDLRATVVNGVTVYGERYQGATTFRLLSFTLPDGSFCQVSGIRATTAADVAAVAERLIEHGIDYDMFALEQGAKHE